VESKELSFTSINSVEELPNSSLSFGLSLQQRNEGPIEKQQVDLMISQVSKVMEDVLAIRSTLRDLDDAQARMMRRLFIKTQLKTT
jgi:hypothetical protein